MLSTTKPLPLAAPLRSRINKLAHEKAARHEDALRAAMTSQLVHARSAGATPQQLADRMAGFERNLGR